MALVYDTFTSVAAGTGTLSWTHTGAADVIGAIVGVAQPGITTDRVNTPTYGTVGMSEMTLSPLIKSSGTDVGIVHFFMLSAPPTGSQTVEVTVSGTGSKRAGCWTVRGTGGIAEVDTTSISQDSGANPSGTLSLGGVTSFCVECFLSGLADVVAGCAPLTNWNDDLEWDAGAQGACWYRYTIISTADVTIGYTAATDDCVLLGVAVRESSAQSQAPRSMHQYRQRRKMTKRGDVERKWRRRDSGLFEAEYRMAA